MKWSFLYQIKAASTTPDKGLPPPDPRSLCPLSSTEFVDPPRPPNKIPGYATGCWGPSSGLDVEKRKYFAPSESWTCWLFTTPTAIPAAVVSCVCFFTSCSTGSESLSILPAHMFHYHTWKSWSIILAAVGDVSFLPRPSVGVEITSFFEKRDKQVALEPAEGYIRFRPRLLFMWASRSIKTFPDMHCRVILGLLEWRNFVCTPIHQHVWPIRFDYHVSGRSLLLPYPLTVCTCHFSYSKSCSLANSHHNLYDIYLLLCVRC